MFQIEGDILMGSRLNMIGVNEDNDDDNDIYIIPFFQRTFQSFYLVCVENVPLEEGKVLLICLSGEKTERVNCPAFRLHFGDEKRCLTDTIKLGEIKLRETPVSVPIHPTQCCHSKPSDITR